MVKKIEAFKTEQGHVYESEAEANEMEDMNRFHEIASTTPFYDDDCSTAINYERLFIWLRNLPEIWLQILPPPKTPPEKKE